MTLDSTPDVLICGAGVSGLALAIELARRNVAFRLIEKSPTPFPGSRGKGLQPRSIEVFEDMGLADRICAHAAFHMPIRHYHGEGFEDEVAEVPPPNPAEPYNRPYLMPQFLTEAALRERLAELGGCIEYGCELLSFTQDGEGVSAELRGPRGEETVRAQYLAGTDGGRSLVRHILEIDFPGENFNIPALVADVEVEGLTRDAWHRWDNQRVDSVWLCPLPGTDLYQLQAPLIGVPEPDFSPAGLTALTQSRSRRSDIRITAVHWSSAYGLSARLAARFRAGRVFLIGDAAHIHPPTGGQGLNTSLQDAYNLGWKLAGALQGADTALLDSYEAERRPIAAGMLDLAVSLLRTLAASGRMRTGRSTEQLDLGYRNGPLGLERPSRESGAGLRAGDRAPDAPCRGAGGAPMRLFELFKGPHWTLLGFEADRAAAPAPRRRLRIHTTGQGGDLVDDAGHIARIYGLARGDWVLVRPDGYIGALVSGDPRAALESYLARHLGPA
ncbi:MAG TPA: FAD-dependent oxidoreductase [Burkholderiales bacterium]